MSPDASDVVMLALVTFQLIGGPLAFFAVVAFTGWTCEAIERHAERARAARSRRSESSDLHLH